MEVVEEVLDIIEGYLYENSTEDSYIEYVAQLIKGLEFNDMLEITELVLDIIEEDEEYRIEEKMSNQAKIKSRKLRKKPAFKKAKRLKQKCNKRFSDKIKKSKKQNIPYVCGVDGKLHKGMSRKSRKKIKKRRKRNKNKIIK